MVQVGFYWEYSFVSCGLFLIQSNILRRKNENTRFKYSVCEYIIMAKEKKEEKKEEVEKQKCSQCGSGQTYIRIKEGTRVCRNCGNVDQIKNG